ncbi:unnamed protein product [Phytomonas sp. Hart1]|nr:unnamed protein product [Phytomonas sp. Hart1]|eukprot:CCW66214.1 unnamed protein product [Phytomonas sp. isolate Hart1]
MDGYSTLLNFYLMSTINTGSTLLDMFLAMLIPLVYNSILRVIREYVYTPIQRAVQCCFSSKVKTSIIVNYDTMHGISLDLNENPVLQEALMHYVGNVVKPTYPFGSYRFTRLAASSPTARNASLADTLRHTYFLQTIPSSEKAVDLSPGLALCIYEDDKQKKEKGPRQNHSAPMEAGGHTDTSDSHGKSSNKQKKTTLVFETNPFAREDAVMSFTQKAFQVYKNDIKRAVDSERYMFQPLLAQKGMRDGKLNGVIGPTSCQRYRLSLEKTFNTLFFPEKEKLIHLIHQFESRSGKFSVPGFPHKLILLLYGPPGTGKTSLVKAIAAHTNRHILSIVLSHIETNRELLNLMHDGRFSVMNGKSDGHTNRDVITENLRPEKVIYMLEDIDAASEVVRSVEKTNSLSTERQGGRMSGIPSVSTIDEDTTVVAQNSNNTITETSEGTTNDESKSQQTIERVFISNHNKSQRHLASMVEDRLSLKGLLRALGGILDAPGRIVVLTTNHVDCLAPALLKPGIVTMKLYMGNFNAECGIEMIKHYFRDDLDDGSDADGNNNDTTTSKNLPNKSGRKPRQVILNEIGNVILDAQKSGAGFSPAEVEQMCAENNTLEELFEALKRGNRTESF